MKQLISGGVALACDRCLLAANVCMPVIWTLPFIVFFGDLYSISYLSSRSGDFRVL